MRVALGPDWTVTYPLKRSKSCRATAVNLAMNLARKDGPVSETTSQMSTEVIKAIVCTSKCCDKNAHFSGSRSRLTEKLATVMVLRLLNSEILPHSL